MFVSCDKKNTKTLCSYQRKLKPKTFFMATTKKNKKNPIYYTESPVQVEFHMLLVQ